MKQINLGCLLKYHNAVLQADSNADAGWGIYMAPMEKLGFPLDTRRGCIYMPYKCHLAQQKKWDIAIEEHKHFVSLLGYNFQVSVLSSSCENDTFELVALQS